MPEVERIGSPKVASLPRSDANGWTEFHPFMMRVAAWAAHILPRGKGAIPRSIGRNFGGKWKTVIRTDTGCRFAVDPANLDLYIRIQQEGAWEWWIRRACIHVMRQGGVMFDIGANAGTMSNEVGLACANVTIQAFEPQRSLAELIAVSAALNQLDCITVYPLAVGACSGMADLHQPAHALHASLCASREKHERVTPCRVVSLDEMVFVELLPGPDLIKIDVEGGELDVLRGATRVIKEFRPVIIFEANDNCQRFGYTREDLFNWIDAHGPYDFFAIAPGDTLAAPKSRAAEFRDLYEPIVR